MAQDVVAVLRGSLPGLPPSERRIAEYVIANPAAVVEQTITELAACCSTSIASVVRFCRNVGFAGYREFRRALASSVGRDEVSLNRFGVSDSDIDPGDSARDVIAKLAFHEARSIEATAEGLDAEALDRIAEAVVAAPRIDVYGVASSGLAAADLQHKLHRIGLTSYSWSDAHFALMSAAVLEPGCIAIGFSHSGLTVEISEFLAAARSAGAVTALVTNFRSSPLAENADHVLTTSTSETLYRPANMSSRIAQLAVVDFLFVRIAQR
ncbi:MurR/RpiR family transcriptional regulator, partial [Jiangella endophytica]|uniref:MurR/RpiR family transcriptional regulator n=1 Tax=Jiangella endophytica TaxID=1623398 RepID=UPI0013003C9F